MAYGTIEIEVSEFKTDPYNDSCLSILFDVRGPGRQYDSIMVSFSDDFVERFFKIPWNKDVVEEQKRILKEQRALFVKWALVKVEQYIKGASQADRIVIQYDEDHIWADKVEKNVIVPASVSKGEYLFVYG